MQSPVEVAQPVAPSVAPVAFDLANYDVERAANAKLVDARGCGGSPDEIVVCAPDQGKFRLKLDRLAPDDPRFSATVGIAPGLTVTPHVEAAGLPGGVQSNRAMVTFKLKL